MENLVLAKSADLEKMIQAAVKTELENFSRWFEKQIDDNDKMLTRDETMKYLNISSSTLYRWTKDGVIKSHGIGDRVYYKLSDVKSSLVRTN